MDPARCDRFTRRLARCTTRRFAIGAVLAAHPAGVVKPATAQEDVV